MIAGTRRRRFIMGDARDGDLSWIDEAADRFEQAWQAGERPRIEAYLAGAEEPRRAMLLEELVRVEAELRGAEGEAPTPNEYRARFPEHAELIDAALTADRATPGAPSSSERPAIVSEIDGDATLAYSVTRGDGRLGPLVATEQQQRLQVAFRPGGVLQGRYAIECEIGAGGMGRVYLGKDLRLDRPVAIKVSLLLGRDDDLGEGRRQDLREAFAEEARLGANLTHPAIATVYDYGFHDDKPFTVFEYLPGETLGDLLRRRGRLPLEEVRLIIGALAQALDFAHARQVVHCDLKPENIRGTGQGPFKVLDLGLAKEFRREVDWSGFAGTPAYAAPEQAAGEPCDGRADQYALALIAYDLLAGQRLFAARDAYELLRLHRSVVPTWLEETLADLPASVCQALARALSKSPDRRFASCGDLAVALGCQFLNTPAPLPAILLEADVRRITIGRTGRFGIGRFLGTAHLALTDDAIWCVQHAEVRRWLLRNIERGDFRVTPPKVLEKGGTTEAEAVRLANRDREAAFILIGRTSSFLALVAFGLTVPGIVSWISEKGVGLLSSPTFAMVLLGVLGGILFFFGLGRGLPELRPWARWVALAGWGTFSLVLVAGMAASLWLSRESRGDAVTGVLLPGVIRAVGSLLLAYPAYFLASRKSSVVFSGVYRSIIDRTPYLTPTVFPDGWIVLEDTLRLKLRAETDSFQSVSFRFATQAECRRWQGKIAALLEQQPVTPREAAQDLPPVPVVLLSRRPPIRYQVLGPLETHAATRRIAEAGLQTRAAIIGADAVLDIQEEILLEYHRTVRRLSGTSVRAVDADGRFEFRSRWYADRVARIGSWAVVLILVSFGAHLLGSALRIAVDSVPLVAQVASSADPSPYARFFALTLTFAIMFITAIHAWPCMLVILVRSLRWPQLLRPLAITIVAMVSQPLLSIAGQLLGVLVSGRWLSMAYGSLFLLDPINWTMLLFGLFMGRAAWRVAGEYRRLMPEGIRRVPWRRVLGGRLSWAATGVYATLLVGFFLWSGALSVSQFRLPTAVNNKVAARPSTLTFSVNEPPDWTSLSTDAVIVPGEAVIAWNTHSEGNVVIFLQKPGHTISPRTLLDLYTLSARLLKAEVKAAEIKTVAGMRAIWLVFTSKGTGQAVDGKSDIPTTAHGVAIPREKDVLVLWLTTPADRYPTALKEFEAMLKTLKVEGKQTKEQAEAQ
jgi:hypothetical protein